MTDMWWLSEADKEAAKREADGRSLLGTEYLGSWIYSDEDKAAQAEVRKLAMADAKPMADAHSKQELIDIAKTNDLDTSGTKPELATRIVEATLNVGPPVSDPGGNGTGLPTSEN